MKKVPEGGALFTEVGTTGWTAPEVLARGPTGPTGTAGPADREVAVAGSGGFGLPADVWSFGVVVWECFGDHHRPSPFSVGGGLWRGGGNPFAGVPTEDYLAALAAGRRWGLDLDDDGTLAPGQAPEELRDLAAQCWGLDPAARPPMAALAARLAALADALAAVPEA